MEDKGLHNLSPASGSVRNRKRVGRGPGSGTGKTAGRGTKGQKSRAGSHNVRPGFEGGQMPIYMRLGKYRGPHHKMSMPMGPFRTYNQPVNLDALEVFEAGTDVTPEVLKQRGIISTLKDPVKILGRGEINSTLNVTVHAVSASARAAIEAAGGTVNLIPGPAPHGRQLVALNKAAGAASTAPAKAAVPADAASTDDASASE
jgi:large subunit ribosomal protein L15